MEVQKLTIWVELENF